MTDEETKLVKEQLSEAYKFQDNTKAFWVHYIAEHLVNKLKTVLDCNPDDIGLDSYEADIQFMCDVFSGFHKKRYEHEDYYHLVLAKYDEDQEPFNHAHKIHKLMDMVEGEITSNSEKVKQD